MLIGKDFVNFWIPMKTGTGPSVLLPEHDTGRHTRSSNRSGI